MEIYRSDTYAILLLQGGQLLLQTRVRQTGRWLVTSLSWEQKAAWCCSQLVQCHMFFIIASIHKSGMGSHADGFHNSDLGPYTAWPSPSLML
jgi:hypothetical protein